MKKIFLLITGFIMFGFYLTAQTVKTDDIVGFYEPEDKRSIIQVFEQNDVYYAKIYWMKEPKDAAGNYKIDSENPDKSLRDRRVSGLVFMTKLRYDKGNKWDGGELYNPKTGKTYSCYLTLKNKNQIEVRCYMGAPLFGKTIYWKRVVLNK